MIIISHRGYWHERAERNQRIAFERSFGLGFGTETDLRDAGGEIVVSHDMPIDGYLKFNELLNIYRKCSGVGLPLALNIKADGLAGLIKAELDRLPNMDAFVFDMAVPDMRSYFEAGIPVFTRMSEVERKPAWLEHSAGIWLDCFESVWFNQELLSDVLSIGKRVCIVSSELHQRDPLGLWSMLLRHASLSNLLLCTDRPEQARDFFKI